MRNGCTRKIILTLPSKQAVRPTIAKLIYVSDQEPGISRVRRGKGFQYILPDKTVLTDGAERARVIRLGLPPAYTDVWICARANGHIQATGMDSASRKQYRYHDDWRMFRDQQKFDQLAEFARVLPRIRRRVGALLNTRGKANIFGKEVAIAALVRLIDGTAIRIGGRSKASKGATTLDMKNVRYEDGQLRLRYRAKGGKRVQCSLRDTRLQKILEVIDDLPGKRLFQYIGIDGEVHSLNSGDVNEWLKQVSGLDSVSAKMFRTWHGSVAAMEAIRQSEKPTIKIACEAGAKVLRNTPAICRKSYIHPEVLALTELAADERALILDKANARINGLRIAENRFAGLMSWAAGQKPGKPLTVE
ncbi:DNA topoisomerase IB [Parasphingorhabdus sp.]|uniref:DNA topoisomerase IB n=1 Tax=Parasphingorhabdus sp. TaxID=2709688 RepID=UPI00300240F0